ncbi:hypothetical protein [Roseiconus lacunae]|uniref:hypothetical protein n=1 Tax=Roseiconus lacunae TaxID=2605694 RepID=UPI0011F29F39|nr:hypothetical protein [Roseiconus lacunae]
MTITIERKWNDINAVDGVSDAEDNLDVSYLLHADNDEDEQDIVTFIQNDANIPYEYLGLQKTRVGFGRHEDTEDYWSATASYASKASGLAVVKLAAGQSRWSVIGGSGQTARRTFAKALVSEHHPTGASRPTLSGTKAELALGLTYRDGKYEIDGIDVPIGSTQVAVQTVWSHANAVTGGRVVAAAEYADIHVTNLVPWNGFAAGTLQIESIQSRQRAGDDPDWDVDMLFNFSRNLTNINLGSGVVIPSKLGHQVLDILYAPETVGGFPCSVIKRAAVLDVFDSISFASVFGI